jgi:hypothetical protein
MTPKKLGDSFAMVFLSAARTTKANENIHWMPWGQIAIPTEGRTYGAEDKSK